MLNTTTRRQWLFSALSGTLAAGTVSATGGCGSILFPERAGQPRGGPLDWKVVALDGIGLFFFFVPGVIAFAVDFYNGTIFLPAHGTSGHGFSAHRPASPRVAANDSTLTTDAALTPALGTEPPRDLAPAPGVPPLSNRPAASNDPTLQGAAAVPTSELFPAGESVTEDRLDRIPLPAGPDRLQQVEQIVTARAGQPVRLEPGSYEMRPLERIEHFWDTLRKTAGASVLPS